MKSSARVFFLSISTSFAASQAMAQLAKVHVSAAPSTARRQVIGPQVQAAPAPPFSGYYRETAASLNCVYQLVPQVAGCDPNNAALNANTTLGAGAIIVVTAEHSPNLATDLAAYSAQFGLPAPNLSVVYANGSASATNCQSAEDSDYASGTFSCQNYTADPLEVAHAMAPAAHLIVVETAGKTITDLAQAVDVANAQATNAGGGEILMTPEFSESSGDTVLESHLTSTPGVIYVAPVGSQGGLSYPGTSPNVISVGLSSISRAMAMPANRGLFRFEGSSAAGAGGFSQLFAAPSYQAVIAGRLGNSTQRAVPDVAAVGNNNVVVWVYNSGGWYGVGSEDVAAGVVAGIANAARATAYNTTTAAELTYMYSKIGTPAFFDVGVGDCGAYDGNFVSAASAGATQNQYDSCTGLGTPRGVSGFGH